MLCIHFPLVTWIRRECQVKFSLILTSYGRLVSGSESVKIFCTHILSPSLFTLHTHITVFSLSQSFSPSFHSTSCILSSNFLCFRMFMLSWTHHRCHWSNHFDRIGSSGVIESRLVQHEHNGWKDGVRELVQDKHEIIPLCSGHNRSNERECEREKRKSESMYAERVVITTKKKCRKGCKYRCRSRRKIAAGDAIFCESRNSCLSAFLLLLLTVWFSSLGYEKRIRGEIFRSFLSNTRLVLQLMLSFRNRNVISAKKKTAELGEAGWD